MSLPAGVSISNIEDENRKHPRSFRIHPRDAREKIIIGGFAKLIFRTVEDSERMWVVVTSHDGKVYKGRLRNHPILITSLNADDEIVFGAEHVADILINS